MPEDKTLSPISIIDKAIKAVPAVRYALGVAGIVAAVAIIAAFRISFLAGLLAFGLMIVAMTVLLVFAKLTRTDAATFRKPGQALIWFSVMLVMATAVLLLTSVFWAMPLDLWSLLGNTRNAGLIPSPSQQPSSSGPTAGPGQQNTNGSGKAMEAAKAAIAEEIKRTTEEPVWSTTESPLYPDSQNHRELDTGTLRVEKSSDQYERPAADG